MLTRLGFRLSDWPAWRLKNLILAVMVGGWAVARWLQTPIELQWTVPVIGSVLLQMIVAVLFALRSKAKREAGSADLAITTASLLIGAWLVSRLPHEPRLWPATAIVCILLGVSVTASGLLWLGRSFAIYPATRRLVTAGPYRLVRHPVYAGEIITLLGITLAISGWLAWLLFLAATASLMWRCIREETLLCSDAAFAAFRAETRYRLVPWVW